MPSARARSFVLPDGVGEAVAGEQLAHLVGIQADVEGQALQHLGLADRLPLAEERAQQALLQLVLPAALGGEMEQAVRVERVPAVAALEVVVEPDGRPPRR